MRRLDQSDRWSLLASSRVIEPEDVREAEDGAKEKPPAYRAAAFKTERAPDRRSALNAAFATELATHTDAEALQAYRPATFITEHTAVLLTGLRRRDYAVEGDTKAKQFL